MGVFRPYVSVIIPTYHDWDRLKMCVKSLQLQTYPTDLFEVIIVNNDPADEVPPTISLPANFAILHESAQGSYAARNKGVAVAKGDILAFTDSDCIPEYTWIEAAVSYFGTHPEIDRIGGEVNLFTVDSRYTLAEAYEVVYAFRQEENVKEDTSVTANMFTRKKVFDKIGLFDSSMFSGGDFEWGKRAAQNNFRIGFSAEVIVHHPARRDLKQLINKVKRVASGNYLMNGEKKSAIFRHIDFLYEIRPPVNEFRLIYSRGKQLTFKLKMLVFLLRYQIRVLRAFEEIKLFYGVVPYRDV
ncbi:glycosyltransferase [Pontibacter anaerobius]|uniref:Glycosyltransferase n=1 Tax=Pontibacter anaerobius TaxID=2993940 RepID=A0ABT3REU7_9BACT|nr:glycosyltransferase [Pontibacter anaerobius]MCX2739944.1 glycosyltransferase [Pontibacter anaerobius]